MIITIGREFGSGGRELGIRLSDELGLAYYDKEIVSEIAKRTSLSEEYVKNIVEHKPAMHFPITTGRTFYPLVDPVVDHTAKIYREQHAILRDMAEKSGCVIVGRCADYILRDLKPFRIFVYADIKSRMARCRERAAESERFSDKALEKRILSVDKDRRMYYEFYTERKWGDRTNYDLCVNTSNIPVKDAADALLQLIKSLNK